MGQNRGEGDEGEKMEKEERVNWTEEKKLHMVYGVGRDGKGGEGRNRQCTTKGK